MAFSLVKRGPSGAFSPFRWKHRCHLTGGDVFLWDLGPVLARSFSSPIPVQVQDQTGKAGVTVFSSRSLSKPSQPSDGAYVPMHRLPISMPKDEYLFLIKHFSVRLAAINVCSMLVPFLNKNELICLPLYAVVEI